jgi:AcrR family transcriptional regulator
VAGLAEIKQQERENRRGLILAAAQKLFAETDFKSVTVREIARAAEVSIGTIYNYYANLDELFFDVFLKGSEEITERLDVEYPKERPCSLDRLCEIYIDYLNENMTYYKMMAHFMLGGRLASGVTEKLNLTTRALMDRVEAILKAEGVKSDTRLNSHALLASLNGLMISYAQYPGRTPAEIRKHTKRLAKLIARRFKQEVG